MRIATRRVPSDHPHALYQCLCEHLSIKLLATHTNHGRPITFTCLFGYLHRDILEGYIFKQQVKP